MARLGSENDAAEEPALDLPLDQRNRGGAILNAELPENPGDVAAHGHRGEEEALGDLPGVESLAHQLHHLPLAGREVGASIRAHYRAPLALRLELAHKLRDKRARDRGVAGEHDPESVREPLLVHALQQDADQAQVGMLAERLLHGRLGVGGLATDLEPLPLEKPPYGGPHGRLLIRDQHPRRTVHVSTTSTSVPPSSGELTRSSPPRPSARSRMVVRPKPDSGPSAGTARSMPQPSSEIVRRNPPCADNSTRIREALP